MEIIAHRRNQIYQLRETDRKYGVEVDIRSSGADLIIHHDPFHSGELFLDWLEHYEHGTLILNVKEEGLEKALIDLMKKRNIDQYFFLDQSFPFLVKYARQGERRCAVRVSEYESITTALNLAGLIDWVWLDCFSKFPITDSEYSALKGAGLKVCLVSPELQGRESESDLREVYERVVQFGYGIDAVCTKLPGVWEELSR